MTLSVWKFSATVGGGALTGCALWLNAAHVAAAEGWASPLVAAGIVVTICAAATPPLGERAAQDGQWLKAICLAVFFVLAVSFSLTASITRSGGHRDAAAASAESGAEKTRLAREAYQTAQETRAAECATGRGPKCRDAETALSESRKALQAASPIMAADPAAERIAGALGISEAAVARYSPMALPFALELGGLVFLAIGLSPRRREKPAAPAPVITHDNIISDVATPAPAEPAIVPATSFAPVAEDPADDVADSIRSFAGRHLVRRRGEKMQSKAVYDAYLKHCDETDQHAENNTVFGRGMGALGWNKKSGRVVQYLDIALRVQRPTLVAVDGVARA